ncbi:hypothetical protein G3I60_42625 [Streptomyces sp. SID13666]|uniref:phosphatase domain-containing protein n=1 Tax=Streptomyces TaxID=1883 RepID=UPI00110744DB|nr:MULTISPECIES: hypothetical protein [Streptomyces]MCZ4100517.1 hypothetical protein [Streptomyces sp. H39-C1]NEA60687.1 hypothetical protein [Streptomyces sp. SID13666]NEA77073.1 hypothetical protein [Streptomyces sp. SID13588]QNA76077.1 hypothetical protein C8250_033075 [Streptomyces sp. So13.3]
MNDELNPSRPLAVFDLDGTLCDTRHRLIHLERQPKDWAAFFAAAVDDPPLAEGVALALETAVACDIEYVTGRPERCRRDTAAWLERHGLPPGRVWMRTDNDRRPARVTKLELLRRLARKGEIRLVVDDDKQVCDAYKGAGFTVRRARWMESAPLLEQAQDGEGRT